jgi:hypothetical protein
MNKVTNPDLKKKSHPAIGLPADIILNDKGLELCHKKSIPCRELTNARGIRKEGFIWLNFKASVLQNMTVNDLIESVEIKRTEYSSVRMELIDLTKLIMYGLVYRKFISEFRSELVSSKQFEQLKRKHPGIITDDLTCSKKHAEKFFTDNNINLSILKNELLMGPYALIDNNPKIDNKTGDESRQILHKLLSTIDTGTWFILYMVLKGEGRTKLLNNLNRIMISNLKKTEIAEYLALILLELLQNSERLHYEYIARKRKLIKDGESILKYLQDSSFRNLVASYAKNNKKSIRITYSIKSNSDDDKRLRFNISIINDGVMPESMRSLLQEQANAGTGSSLADFYYANEGNMSGSGLGMHYLSYIEDACREQGINFDARIINDFARDETEYKIILFI